MRNRSWWRRRSALVAGAVGLAACGTSDEAPAPGAASEPRVVAAVTVTVIEAAQGYPAAGYVRALHRAELATRAMGRIESIRVRAGDRVRPGQVLVTLERGVQSASREQAVAARDLALTTLRRMERLYADSAIPIAELDAAKAAHARAEAATSAAAAELAYTELVAPFAGTVAARLAEPGDLASPGHPILVLEGDGPREIVVSAPAHIADAVRPGAAVTVEIGAEQREVAARVRAVVPAADRASRTVDIRLTTDVPLVSNLTAVAQLPRPGAEPTLLVPASALIERGQLVGVMLIASDATARLRWIRTGRRVGEQVQVVSGLEPGDVVVRSPGGVRDGERVEARLETEAGS